MNTYHLQYFLDAAQAGSMSKAAQLNRVSHSAISQSIKSLENELKVELLKHSRRRFELTPEGELCAQKVKALLENFRQFKLEVQDTTNEPVGEMTVIAPQSLVVQSLSKSLIQFHRRYPKINLRTHLGAAHLVRARIADHSADVGILVDDGLLQDFEAITLDVGHFILVSRKYQPSAKGLSIIVTQLDKPEVSHFRKNYRQHFSQEAKVELEMMSWGVLKSMCLQEGLVVYVPEYCVRAEIEQKKLQVIPLPWTSFRYRLKAIWLRGRLSRNAKLFLDELKGTKL